MEWDFKQAEPEISTSLTKSCTTNQIGTGTSYDSKHHYILHPFASKTPDIRGAGGEMLTRPKLRPFGVNAITIRAVASHAPPTPPPPLLQQQQSSQQPAQQHRQLLFRHQHRAASTAATTTTTPKVIFSGIQPTGVPHLGNYLGALKQWVHLQNTAEPGTKLLFSVVDLHAITAPGEVSAGQDLRQRRRETLAALMAIGLDPERSILFYQSSVCLFPSPPLLFFSFPSFSFFFSSCYCYLCLRLREFREEEKKREGGCGIRICEATMTD